MENRDRLVLLIGGPLALAVGAFLFVSDGSSGRFLGVTSLLFGVAALAALPLAWRSSERPRFEDGLVGQGDSPTPGLVFRFERWRVALIAVGSIAFAIVGAMVAVLTLPTVVGPVIGLAGVLLFGAAGATALIALVRGAYVALTPDGVSFHGGLEASFLPWDTIETCRLFRMGAGPMLSFRLRARTGVRMSRTARAVTPINRLITRADIVWTLSGLSSPRAVRQAIRYYLDHPRSRATLGLEPPPASAISVP